MMDIKKLIGKGVPIYLMADEKVNNQIEELKRKASIKNKGLVGFKDGYICATCGSLLSNPKNSYCLTCDTDNWAHNIDRITPKKVKVQRCEFGIKLPSGLHLERYECRECEELHETFDKALLCCVE